MYGGHTYIHTPQVPKEVSSGMVGIHTYIHTHTPQVPKELSSGMVVVGKKNKKLAGHELWVEWVHGRGVPKAVVQNASDKKVYEGGIWDLSREERRVLMETWREEQVRCVICMHTYLHACIHAHIHTYIYTYIHA